MSTRESVDDIMNEINEQNEHPEEQPQPRIEEQLVAQREQVGTVEISPSQLPEVPTAIREHLNQAFARELDSGFVNSSTSSPYVPETTGEIGWRNATSTAPTITSASIQEDLDRFTVEISPSQLIDRQDIHIGEMQIDTDVVPGIQRIDEHTRRFTDPSGSVLVHEDDIIYAGNGREPFDIDIVNTMRRARDRQERIPVPEIENHPDSRMFADANGSVYVHPDDIIYRRINENLEEIDIAETIRIARERQGLSISGESPRELTDIEKVMRAMNCNSSRASNYLLSRSRHSDLLPLDPLLNLNTAVIGVGAIGNHLVDQLVAIGLLHLQLIDPDQVSVENIGVQGYTTQDIGQNKTTVCRSQALRISPIAQITRRTMLFHRRLTLGDIIFSCVDSIQTRKEIWDIIKSRPSASFWCDGRMLGETMRILCAYNEDTYKHYDTTLFPQEEAEEGSCTTKSTAYCANIASALMCSQFTQWLRGMSPPPDITVNLLSCEMFETPLETPKEEDTNESE